MTKTEVYWFCLFLSKIVICLFVSNFDIRASDFWLLKGNIVALLYKKLI
jgi:hypothetical protein